MVAAFHKWVQRYTAGEGAPWSPLGAGEVARALPARASQAEVLERYESHVKHCAACSGALANIPDRAVVLPRMPDSATQRSG